MLRLVRCLHRNVTFTSSSLPNYRLLFLCQLCFLSHHSFLPFLFTSRQSDEDLYNLSSPPLSGEEEEEEPEERDNPRFAKPKNKPPPPPLPPPCPKWQVCSPPLLQSSPKAFLKGAMCAISICNMCVETIIPYPPRLYFLFPALRLPPAARELRCCGSAGCFPPLPQQTLSPFRSLSFPHAA